MRADTIATEAWRVQVKLPDRVLQEFTGNEAEARAHFIALALPATGSIELQVRPAGKSRFKTVELRMRIKKNPKVC